MKYTCLLSVLLLALLCSSEGVSVRSHTDLADNSFSQEQAIVDVSTEAPIAIGAKVDSLKTVIETAGHDTTKIKALNALGWKFMYSNPDTAIELSKQALAIAEKTEDLKNKAYSHSSLAVYYTIKSDYPTALDYHFKALKYREKQNYLKGMAGSYNNIGIIYRKQSDYPQALAYYFKSLKICE